MRDDVHAYVATWGAAPPRPVKPFRVVLRQKGGKATDTVTRSLPASSSEPARHALLEALRALKDQRQARADGFRLAARQARKSGFPGLRVAARMDELPALLGSIEEVVGWERMAYASSNELSMSCPVASARSAATSRGSVADTVQPPDGSGPAEHVQPSSLARSAMPSRP